jgi:hypothetical protein
MMAYADIRAARWSDLLKTEGWRCRVHVTVYQDRVVVREGDGCRERALPPRLE